MSCGDGTDPACPCGVFIHPQVITNPPGLTKLAARSGDYLTYRHALLQVLPGETELSRSGGTTTTLLWRPSAEGDLALAVPTWVRPLIAGATELSILPGSRTAALLVAEVEAVSSSSPCSGLAVEDKDMPEDTATAPPPAAQPTSVASPTSAGPASPKP